MTADLSSVDLQPLAQLLDTFAPGDAMAVLARDGTPVWRSGACVASLDAVLVDGGGTAEPVSPKRVQGCLILRHALIHPNLELLGTLIYCTPGDGAGAEACVSAMTECVVQLVVQAGELDDMALELTGRYEELNLLYTLDERRDGYDPASGHEALCQMVTDCSAFLDVGMSCLHAPAEHLDLCIAGEEAADLRALWPSLRSHLLRFACERNVATVVNHEAEWRALGFVSALPGKLLLVPVRHVDGNVSGVLCTLNPYARPDFSNSDRKLMEVLADQASRIIQRSYDPVTGLLNRHGFGRRAAALLGEATDQRVALLHLNLDSIRMVNDSAGRRAGDAMLRRVAALLAAREPEGGLVGHLGGDEFVMLFAAGVSLQQVRRDAVAIQAALTGDGFRFEGKSFDISTCAGIADGEAAAGLSDLLSGAEAACRVAKTYGRGHLRVYDPNDDRYLDRQRQAAWGPRIIEALSGNEFVLFAQAIVPVDEQQHPAHYEVLVRLPERDGRVLLPGSFMSAAERYGLMPRLDRLVLKMAVDFMRRRAQQSPHDDFVLAVNISGQSLADGEYLAHALDIISASGLPFSRLCFEVTETAAIADFDAAVRFIDAVRTRGSRVALDDFGSGLSSFGYLRRLPVDYLKIDGQIVRAIAEDPINAVMVDSIHRIARVMGIATIAEFVENTAILQALRLIGVDFAQGYGIGRPRPIEETVPSGLQERPRIGAMVAMR